MNNHSMPYPRRSQSFLALEINDLDLMQVNPNSSVLSSIIYTVREYCTDFISQEDEVRSGYQGESGNSTEVSVSPSQDSMDNVWFIELISQFNGKVIVGKPFSMILRIKSLEQDEVTLERPVGFSILLENSDTGDTLLLEYVQSNSILYLKQISVKQYIKHARLIVRSDNEDILSYAQNIEIRKKKHLQ